MSTQQLFIPDKIKVGFQNRDGTYTGKLAYVIYYDQKGKLRKETSWQSWRDSNIKPIECGNEPTESFVLNKGVGGVKQSYGWNTRNEYIRVYDPRDFEFEISVSNLLFILRECDCSRGKGLEGKFVYAWDGTELVLLPVTCQDYQNSKKFTALQSQKVSAKDLIPGATYITRKDQRELVYLGRFDRYRAISTDHYYSWDKCFASNEKSAHDKVHVFWNGKSFDFESGATKLAAVVSDTPVANLAELIDAYYKSIYGSPVVRLELRSVQKPKDARNYGNCAYEDDGRFVLYSVNYDTWAKETYVATHLKVFLSDGILKLYTWWNESCPPGSKRLGQYWHRRSNTLPWQDLPNKPLHRLYAVLESGAEYMIGTNGLLLTQMNEENDGEEN